MLTEPRSTSALAQVFRPVLDDFRDHFELVLRLSAEEAGERVHLYDGGSQDHPPGTRAARTLHLRDGPELLLEVAGAGERNEAFADVLEASMRRSYDFTQEVRFFTHELSERYEEINLLYSISETLGSIFKLEEAARLILEEVCDLLGARRGSLWVHDTEADRLELTASFGEEGRAGPLSVDDPEAVTSRVFREGKAYNEGSGTSAPTGAAPGDQGSWLSIPIHYSPPAGVGRTVGVINLIGRRRGGRFTPRDQKLLTAIASQVGQALENRRLLVESLAQERVSREMELAHHLQMKLLPAVDHFEGAEVAARVEPAESVGGDFYNLFHLADDRIGVMLGDVSGHGFPAALIMALSMSAATIYASEFGMPAKVLRHIDDALREEFENTEVYLSLFYGVIDPKRRKLTYSNAGHPHAFVVHADRTQERLVATDPPVGIAGPEAYSQEEVPWVPSDDVLFLFTDGLSDFLTSEATGKGEEFVLASVAEHCCETPAQIVDALFEATKSVTPSIPSDDRTALVVRV